MCRALSMASSRTGKLVAVKGQGVQDPATGKPVDADSLFRIASMSKAFTALAILKLRDEGKLSLDALAETYVPEMKGWTYPTSDSRRIRVRDLLNHSAGFVTDDPWGDRQQPLTEAEFTRMLKAGVPFCALARHCHGIFQLRLCPARPHHHQCLGPALPGLYQVADHGAARHGLDRA